MTKATDATAPLHTLQPDYPVPYGIPTIDSIVDALGRIHTFLNTNTPAAIIDKTTGKEIVDYRKIDGNSALKQGDFRLLSYEWGVLYAGMLLATESTGQKKFAEYVAERLRFIGEVAPLFRDINQESGDFRIGFSSVNNPGALDHAGAICAAMIKTQLAGYVDNLQPLIENFIDWIHNREFRLPDGTLARNRPHRNTLWLDDLFMSVPALVQMTKMSGEKKYLEDALKQLRQFSRRMFVGEKGLYMHGWVEEMPDHPAFHWGRANGWAILTKIELLEVLPEDHPERQMVLDQLHAHVRGIARYQAGSGFWHQLLDRSDSYLETSATAIFAYCLARGINNGYLDPVTYAPMTILAWNAVSTQVNEHGHVEGTCVGTGMGFDPAFYCYRPINAYAAHGYGPVVLAGAEVIRLLKSGSFEMNDSALMYYRK
ncbi:MAG TPA: glycoside hydrolase family 88 protein [Calditrichia bacterium]|nr:glycoside hydrolase family 88 protein [Calditrichota bacterium]HQU70938.1 glycoside hydrolase family 88 protein [Calditrichia bacterium]HQV32890.1 glycoside hydrolase family 88 protein [Calditrichia bacterium]